MKCWHFGDTTETCLQSQIWAQSVSFIWTGWTELIGTKYLSWNLKWIFNQVLKIPSECYLNATACYCTQFNVKKVAASDDSGAAWVTQMTQSGIALQLCGQTDADPAECQVLELWAQNVHRLKSHMTQCMCLTLLYHSHWERLSVFISSSEIKVGRNKPRCILCFILDGCKES